MSTARGRRMPTVTAPPVRATATERANDAVLPGASSAPTMTSASTTPAHSSQRICRRRSSRARRCRRVTTTSGTSTPSSEAGNANRSRGRTTSPGSGRLVGSTSIRS
jgi:hypothetical protein